MKKTVSLSGLIIAVVAVIIVTFMLTFSFTSYMYENKYKEEFADSVGLNDDQYNEYRKIADIIDDKSIFDIDKDAVFSGMINGYLSGIGDKYAFYMTDEEYTQWLTDNTGVFCGIGVNVFASVYDEDLYIEVFNVIKDSPADKAGVLAGDVLYEVITDDGKKNIAEIGYSEAIDLIKGEEGTDVTFTVVRGGDFSNPITLTATRANVISQTVMYHVSTTDANIGIINILGFDVNTPVQFSTAVDSLLADGITKFVFDVRDNPGGDLKSINAVLSYFLNEGDTVVRTVDSSDNWVTDKVEVVKYTGDYASCSVTSDDIGKYRELDYVVLVNENTASAAELFTSALMDYQLAEIIGVKTYGKGSMQEIFNLSYYGCSGGLKLTTKLYYPPISDNYDGIGITPDIVVEMDKAYSDISKYKLTEDQDNQLQTALNALK